MKNRDFCGKIELTNDGQLSLFFLGAGSAFTKKNFQNNFLIVKGTDHVLVDCGTLCPYSFHLFNSDITEIENILITHSHADHIGGLEEVALSDMYCRGTKPRLILTNEYKKILWNWSLRGGLSVRGEDGLRQKMTFDDYFEQLAPVKVRGTPRPCYEIFVGGIKLTIFRTKHLFSSRNTWKNSFYSLGVLIDDRILFSGDSKNDPELIDWITHKYQIEGIFHDCQFQKNAVHASYDELKETLSPELRQKTFICHYNDGCENTDVASDGFAGLVRRGIYYDF